MWFGNERERGSLEWSNEMFELKLGKRAEIAIRREFFGNDRVKMSSVVCDGVAITRGVSGEYWRNSERETAA